MVIKLWLAAEGLILERLASGKHDVLGSATAIGLLYFIVQNRQSKKGLSVRASSREQ